jgi:hypothetical protein
LSDYLLFSVDTTQAVKAFASASFSVTIRGLVLRQFHSEDGSECPLQTVPLPIKGIGIRSLAGMWSKITLRQGLVRVMAVALALTALMFIVQAVSHIHPDGQEQAACQLCQITHTGIVASANAPMPIAPLVSTGPVVHPTLTVLEEDFSFGFPARAPPTEVAL